MNELHIDKTHWKKYRFDEVCRQVNEATKDPFADGLDHVVGLEHIEPNNLHITQWDTLEKETTFTRKFKKGQVLFGRRRAYQRKVAYADFDGICSGDILVFEAIEDVLLPELLPFLIQSEGFFQKALATSAGSLSPRTKFKELADYEFLLPPKAEQKRLAELLWAADEVVEKEKREREKITVCKNNFFEREIIGAKKLRLIDCCKEPPQYGSPSAAIPYTKEKSRYIRITDIDDFGNLINEDIVSPSAFSYTFLLKENDFLIARTGNTVGKTYLHQIKDGLYTFAGYLIRFRTDDSILLPEYLMAFSKTSLFEEFKRKTIKVGAQPNINAEQYSNMEIPVLQIEKQRKIKQNIDKFDSVYRSVLSQIALSQQIKQELINKIY
jgi:restriction endonuclease S subunit